MGEPIVGVLRGGCLQKRPEKMVEMFLLAGRFSSEVALELAPQHLNGIEVGRVGRQKQPGATSLFHHLLRFWAFVSAEVVQDDDLSRQKRGQEHLFNERLERQTVGCAFETHHGLNTVQRQGAQDGRAALPVARHPPLTPHAFGRATKAPVHGGVHAALVQKHHLTRIERLNVLPPLVARRLILLMGFHTLFLRVHLTRKIARPSVARLTRLCPASCHKRRCSSIVASGCSCS